MAKPTVSIPKRFKIALRWQWLAVSASVVFFVTCFIGWPLGYLWPSAIAFVGFLPAVCLFNIKCYKCGYPAFADYQADELLSLDDRFWARLWGKEYGGIHLPLRRKCSKCGAPFVENKD